MKEKLIGTLEQLASLPGVSGDEGAVRDAILRRLEGKCDVQVDPLGNVIAFKKGKAEPKNKLLFSAHMDEVGFIITHVEDSGLLRFDTCGGIDTRVIIGKAVEVGDRRIPGVIGVKAIHHASEKERETPLKVDSLTIDIGAKDKEQALALAKPGDRAVFYGPVRLFGADKLMGRAFDDRAGCALMIHMIESDLPYDCHFSFTVQEETGLAGGTTAGYTVDPDIAVAIETTTASDIGGVEEGKEVCKLGGGPVVSFMDKGTIYDRELFRLALKTAKEQGISAQVKEGVYGGNESRVLQTAKGGARAMGVSLPCRYLHSPNNVLQGSDLEETFRLLRALVETLGPL